MSSPDYRGFAQRVREAMEDEGYTSRYCDCDASTGDNTPCLYCEAVALAEAPDQSFDAVLAAQATRGIGRKTRKGRKQ